MLGPQIMGQLTPEETGMFKQVMEEYNAGRPWPAAQILQNLIKINPERMGQLAQEAAPMFGMVTPGLQGLFVQQQGGVPYPVTVGREMAGRTGAISAARGSMSQRCGVG